MITAFTSNWYIFFPLAFSLFISLRLAQGSTDDGRSSRGLTVVRSVIATLFVFALLGVGLRSHILSFFWMALGGFFAGALFWKNRRLERSALLLSALHAETEPKQLSLTETFWIENRGWLRRTAASLRRDNSAGKSWWRALEERRIAKGVYERLAVRLIALYGPSTKQKSHKQAAGELLTPLQVEAEVERMLGRLFIFSWTVFVFPLITMIIVFIVPTFKEMFEEFGLKLPPMMLAVIAVADVVSKFGLFFALVLVPWGIAIVFLMLLLWFFPQVLQRYPFRWLCNDYFRTAGFSALSYAIANESNLTLACQATGRLLAVEDLGRQYQVAASLLEEGMLPQQALLQAGLLERRERDAFQIGFDHRDPSWCLQQLAGWKMSRMFARYSVLIQCAIVIITLLLAVVIGSVAVGVIQVLSTMINSLA